MSSSICAKLIEAKRQIGAIAKDQVNQMQRFNFRGIDQVYNSMHGILAKVGIVTVPEVLECTTHERPAKNNGVLRFVTLKVRYSFFAEDGSTVYATVIGEAMDSGDKAVNKAMSAAHKYALLQVFMVPTQDVTDGDTDSPEPASLADDQQLEQLDSLADGHDTRTGYLAKWRDRITQERATEIISQWSKAK